jgi:hypothetical protein
MRAPPLFISFLALACHSSPGSSDAGHPIEGDAGRAPEVVNRPIEIDAGHAPDGPFVAPADHRYCPGVEPHRAGTITCLTAEFCSPYSTANRSLQCVSQTHPFPPVCGGQAPREECRKDLDCGPGKICQVAMYCGGSACRPACTPEICSPDATCLDGRCVPKRCDEPGALPCAQDWSCRPGPGTTATFGCAADSCKDGYRCPLPFDCSPGAAGADPHGCARRACARSADCACGSCVLGVCESAPGVCDFFTSPP